MRFLFSLDHFKNPKPRKIYFRGVLKILSSIKVLNEFLCKKSNYKKFRIVKNMRSLFFRNKRLFEKSKS